MARPIRHRIVTPERVRAWVWMCLLALAVPSVPAAAHVDAQTDVAQLARMVFARQPGVRDGALAALRGRGEADVVPALIQALRFVPEDDEINAALHALTGAEGIETWHEWILWQEGHPEIEPFDGFDAGGVPAALAYCTLCGSGILFETAVAGRPEPFVFGSSGFLYRSNKLMYDRETNSLWNQFLGSPVVGPLTGSGIELEIRPVVITSWGDWRAGHPHTKVLSLALLPGIFRHSMPGTAAPKRPNF